ncbi:hypothetical protein [Anaerocolumna sp. MB42-C2]|uniref:hypothetical protein n=1 Tax=Anaerocolumna sp. MB42-C2 TaxID=3070997 RepID=UPI0027DEB1F2|nr:hypothetical protein [Anaerocolumna sp. MB42-C2]WMJ89207.1 hypothetical protein RBU59_06685 [Anaerocolumna sp. MB42-C2]
MQLVGEIVHHTKFGEGKVSDKADRILTILFPVGEKKFYYPDAFEKHLTLKNKRKQQQINKLVDNLVEERKRCENIKLEKQKAYERIWNLKVKPNSQAAFGFVNNSIENAFSLWTLSTGVYLSGNQRGLPRVPQRIQLNSACLLTICPDGLTEKYRKIIGVFMARNDFDGRLCRDGIIHSHEKYRIKLESSEELSFWNYFVADAATDNWGNIEIRYFCNKTMQKILKDIREKAVTLERREFFDEFYRYFLRVNKLLDTDECEGDIFGNQEQDIYEGDII